MSPANDSGAPTPILEARKIVKRFGGVTALDGVDLTVFPGEVLCLAGENGCGKSTLIKIISGAERPDAGSIVIDGDARVAMDPTDAIKRGIQVIYQDFSLFPNLTVAENINLTSAVADRSRLFERRRARVGAKAVIDELGLSLPLDVTVEQLSVADKQLTAICRALVSDARLIVMDEPTTALTHTEVGRLFGVVERLRARGVALIFVSHKLDEVLTISQRITILRSGKLVASGPTTEFDRYSITRHMTGQELDESRRLNEVDGAEPAVLQVDGLGLDGAFEGVSFTLGRGEILGITGLLGSGRGEIAEALFGVAPYDEGEIRVDGEPVAIRSINDAIGAGIGYVPEDRLTQGLFLESSIADNIIAGSIDQHCTAVRTMDSRASRATIKELFERLRIKAPNTAAPVRSLSGGNAQRVVLAKWLARGPRVLILNGPTVGVDVGSKAEILDLLRAEAESGRGIIVISDDAPELVSCCHRVLVVRGGRIAGELVGDGVTVDAIRTEVAA